MQAEPCGELPDRDRPSAQTQVPVQAIPGVVGQRLVDLDRGWLGHSRTSDVSWISTVCTVRIKLRGEGNDSGHRGTGAAGAPGRHGSRDRAADRGHRHAPVDRDRRRSGRGARAPHDRGLPAEGPHHERRDRGRPTARRRRTGRRAAHPDEPGAAREAGLDAARRCHTGAPAADPVPADDLGDRRRLGQGRGRQVLGHGEPRRGARRRGKKVGRARRRRVGLQRAAACWGSPASRSASRT